MESILVQITIPSRRVELMVVDGLRRPVLSLATSSAVRGGWALSLGGEEVWASTETPFVMNFSDFRADRSGSRGLAVRAPG